MSTISPVAVRRMHADLKAAGVAFLDAPVSGGPVGAKNASLSIMAGGDKDAFLRAEPYFRAMGTTITHVGEAGAGQTVKLCNQLVCAINLQAICEALALGRASGVDLDQLRNVLLGGSAASWMLDKLGPAMIAGDASRRLPHRPDAQGSASRAGAGAFALRPAARNGAGDQPVCRGARSRRRHERQSGSFPGLRPNDEPGCDLSPGSRCDEPQPGFRRDPRAMASLPGGALLTLQLAFIATVLGSAIGVLGAIGRRSSHPMISRICGIYVEAIRNTPLLVQIFLVYFGLASLGLKFSAFTVAAAALTINVGAYTTEIIRAGFDSIPRGQIEAAEGLALSRAQIYWHVVLLPAIEKVYPALTSQFVLLMLASSVTSQISAEELTAVANYVQSDTYRAFETYILVALVYIVLSLVMRAGFWLLGLVIFPRRRRLGTPL